jgi:hypothetical protein
LSNSSRGLQASAAVGTALALGALLITTAGAAPRTTIAPRGHSGFAPAVGDWDGMIGGLRASFELVRYPHGTAFGASGFAIRDLVYQSPTTCSAITDPALSTFVAYADSPPPFVLVGADGRFPFGTRPLYGSFSSPTQAAISEGYTIGSPGTAGRCSGRLRFSLAPAHRVPAADGTWRLTAADGSGGSFSVRADGRIAYGLPLSSITAHCGAGTSPGSFTGQVALFIRPDGTASETVTGSGARIALNLRFVSATSATGQYVASATGCTPTTLAFTAAPSR